MLHPKTKHKIKLSISLTCASLSMAPRIVRVDTRHDARVHLMVHTKFEPPSSNDWWMKDRMKETKYSCSCSCLCSSSYSQLTRLSLLGFCRSGQAVTELIELTHIGFLLCIIGCMRRFAGTHFAGGFLMIKETAGVWSLTPIDVCDKCACPEKPPLMSIFLKLVNRLRSVQRLLASYFLSRIPLNILILTTVALLWTDC